MAVIKERNKWLQNKRKVGLLGLVADQLSIQLRGWVLSCLILMFVCLALAYMQSLSTVRREIWCLIPGWLCLPIPLPIPHCPCKVLLLLANPPLIIAWSMFRAFFQLPFRGNSPLGIWKPEWYHWSAKRCHSSFHIGYLTPQCPPPGWCHLLFRVVPGEDWDKRWPYLLSYL